MQLLLINEVAEGFFNFFFNVITAFINTIYYVPATLVTELLENLGIVDMLTSFQDVIITYIVPYVGFFVNLVPPTTWTLLQFYFAFMIGLYSIVFFLHYNLKVLHLIKKLVPMA